MSEVHTNGVDAPAPATRKRQQVARTTIDGPHVSITFSDKFDGDVLEFDVTLLPEALKPSVMAYGVAHALASAYNSVGGRGNPVQSARAQWAKMVNGTWHPGMPRGDKQPDVLNEALIEHLQINEHEIEPFIVKYMREKGISGKHGVATARRALRQHPAVAPIVARIMADRARAVASAAKRSSTVESLTV